MGHLASGTAGGHVASGRTLTPSSFRRPSLNPSLSAILLVRASKNSWHEHVT
jgi:hypothetical protein